MQYLLREKENQSDNDLSPLESGFESLKGVFSMGSSFFLLAVLFVIFDVELILVLPMIISYSLRSVFFILCVLTLAVILLTLLLEWVISGLKWQA